MILESHAPAGRRPARLLAGLALVLGWACGVPARADCPCDTPSAEFAAERAGLVREWLVQVPFDAAAASVEHVVVDRDLVVVQTGDGNVIAVRAGAPREGEPLPGTILWKHPIDGRAGPFQPAAIGDSLVAVAHGDGIHAFDRATGAELWSSRFSRLADTGPAVSAGWVYTPFGEGKLMRLPTNPFRRPTVEPAAPAVKGQAAAKRQPGRQGRKPGGTGPQKVESLDPVVLEAAGAVSLQPERFGAGVVWCTDDGTIVVLEPSGDGWRRNDFFLDERPAGRPLVHDGAIFACTAEGDLVRIDSLEEAAGNLRAAWRVFLDAVPEPTLFASGERLVVPLGDDGLAAFSTKTGAPLWRTSFRGRVVALAAGRIWLVDRVGRLVSLDLETAEPRGRHCLGGFTFPLVNQATDRLILASPSGAVVSFAAPRPADPAQGG
ncbi:MAG: hypothetical protein EBZ74_03540 [Planctomycetia bacterium]|nr:hypothetical protein [Planctomycetia bacterium]